MSENTKINLDALMKGGSTSDDTIDPNRVETSDNISMENTDINKEGVDTIENPTNIDPTNGENNPVEIDLKLNLNLNQEDTTDQMSEKEDNKAKVEVEDTEEKDTKVEDTTELPLKTSEEETEVKQEAASQKQSAKKEQKTSRKHSLSLGRLKTRGKTEEEIKKEADQEAEILKNLEKVNDEKAQDEAGQAGKQEEELFGNYESKFTNQSTEILKRLRVPKTRKGMLLSLSILCIIAIGVLMYIDPNTHSISNYKASVMSIYNDMKKGETEETPKPIEINRGVENINKENTINEEISEEVETPEETATKKEEIKKENLKNFLLENYK